MPAIRCDRCHLIWNANLAVGYSCAECGQFLCPECGPEVGLDEHTTCDACRRKRRTDALKAIAVTALLAVVTFLCAWGWCNCLSHGPMMMGR